MPAPLLLQICPNDLAPFAQICGLYAQAAERLGATCITVYLAQRAAQPVEPTQTAGQVHYLRSAEDTPANNRQLLGSLNLALQSLAGNTMPQLTLCHRHRSYRVLRGSQYLGQTNIVLAHEYGMLARWQRKLDRWLFGRSFIFAGIAPAVAAELAAVTGDELVLPNALDVQALVQRLQLPASARRLLGLEHWKIREPQQVIGVVGRLHRKKRPELALQGFAALTNDASYKETAQLLFIGDGELRQALEQQAATASLAAHFCGFVQDAPNTLKGLDVLLLTSSAAEAFGMVALEALAAGVPVVAPNIPGPKSVLGDLGFYFDESDRMQSGDQQRQAVANNIAQALREALTLAQSERLTQWQQQASARVQQHFCVEAAMDRLAPWLGAPS